jgi:hypothetical protein
MDDQELLKNVAYCGLVCSLCDHNPVCTWCRNPPCNTDRCDKDHCYHRQCCLEKGLAGCWECEDFPCSSGRFVDENRGQTVGFIKCIREQGIEGFINILQSNAGQGIRYGMSGDYRHKTEAEVLALLHSGEHDAA